VNSHQRRKHLRSASSSGVTSLPQSSKPKKAKAIPKRRFLAFLTIGKTLWAIVVGAATLLSYVVLKPNISIEPYASQDPHRPFAEQFYLQNNSVYAIHEVMPRCGIGNVRAGNVTMRDFSMVNPFDMVGTLAPGAKTTVTCILDQLFKDTPQSYGQLHITIWATYKLPFGISGCQATNFGGKPASDGTYIWTYRGSLNCKDLDKPD
jgi:hypothetical protein